MAKAPRSGYAWLFPVGAFALLPLACFVGYGIGVARNDIERFWPYVSDTGASPPESCIFGQLVNMSAALMMVSLYLRHRCVMAFHKVSKTKHKGVVISSRIFLGVGIFACFGLMLVANFQEQQVDVSPVHYTGAGLAFVLGIAYGWYQSFLSFKTSRRFTPRWLAICRLVICIFGTICFVGVFARNIDKQVNPLPTSYFTSTAPGLRPKHFYRGPNDPGYAAFLVTTISEWCLAMTLAVFFLTLAFDLKKVGNIHPPRISLYIVDKEKDSPDTFVAIESEAPRPLATSAPPSTVDSSTEESPEERLHYRPSKRLKGVPLPGLTDDPQAEKQYMSFLVGNSTELEPVIDSDQIKQQTQQRPRGLRRSYENAIQLGDEMTDPVQQPNGSAGSNNSGVTYC